MSPYYTLLNILAFYFQLLQSVKSAKNSSRQERFSVNYDKKVPQIIFNRSSIALENKHMYKRNITKCYNLIARKKNLYQL